jgi:hypothetical protein
MCPPTIFISQMTSHRNGKVILLEISGKFLILLLHGRFRIQISYFPRYLHIYIYQEFCDG